MQRLRQQCPGWWLCNSHVVELGRLSAIGKSRGPHLSFSSAGFINWVWNAPATANLTVMRALNSFAIFSTACKRPQLVKVWQR